MPYITEMTTRQARAYLFKSSSYCSIELPPYFDFRPILMETNKIIRDDFIKFKSMITAPSKVDGVNYRVISNKDGSFGWRPFEIIHPLLYVRLVRVITTPQNWRFILSRFADFSNTVVECKSIPFQSDGKKKDKASQVMNWWSGYEQASLELALEYEYLYEADISDCYGSIYTHSICWALHTKPVAKEKKSDKSLLGNQIDGLIQDMRYGQTNGIPQGSILMDFIAEMVLGHADELLTEALRAQGIAGVRILRYRDDYRIFSNDPKAAGEALKHLSIVLSWLGMKLNALKTKSQHDLIRGAIKPDKHALLTRANKKLSFQKDLLSIYNFALEHPNSGSLLRLLSSFHDQLSAKKGLGKFDNPVAMVSILTNLAARNPKAYSWSMIIVDYIIDLQADGVRHDLANKVRARLARIPHTGVLDIWMQRVFFRDDPDVIYPEGALTKIVSADHYPANPSNNCIWNMDWVKGGTLKQKLLKTWIIDIKKKVKINDRSTSEEVNIFEYES